MSLSLWVHSSLTTNKENTKLAGRNLYLTADYTDYAEVLGVEKR
jgi:hypothetical protein